MKSETHEQIVTLAVGIRRRRLTTIALMLLELAEPLTFVGKQALYAVGPFFPDPRWQTSALALATIVEDTESRAFLQHLLSQHTQS